MSMRSQFADYEELWSYTSAARSCKDRPDAAEEARLAAIAATEVPGAGRDANAAAYAARNELIRPHLALVPWCAFRFHARCDRVEIDELIQAGNLGLIAAAGGYLPAKGARFVTYATTCIWRRMQRAMKSEGRASRPVCFSRFEEDHFLGLAYAEDDDGEWGRRADEVVAGEESNRAARDAAREMLGCLTDRERAIVRARVGMDGPPRTLAALGEDFGISKERVRQIESAAAEKMARAGRRLEPFQS